MESQRGGGTPRAVADPPGLRPPESSATARVWLRRARLDDAVAIFTAYACDPDATRYLTWGPRTRVEEVTAWLAPSVAGWDRDTVYRWVLVDAPDGDAFGTVVLRRAASGFDLGYALASARTGRGIATEVVAHVLGLVGVTDPGAVVSARTDPENTGSRRVLERCGFRFQRRVPRAVVRPGLGPAPRDALVFARTVTPPGAPADPR